jgi:hypothetical protein
MLERGVFQLKGHRPELRVLYRRDVVPGPKGWEEFASDFEMQPALRTALDMGMAQTIAHVGRAFC